MSNYYYIETRLNVNKFHFTLISKKIAKELNKKIKCSVLNCILKFPSHKYFT